MLGGWGLGREILKYIIRTVYITAKASESDHINKFSTPDTKGYRLYVIRIRENTGMGNEEGNSKIYPEMSRIFGILKNMVDTGWKKGRHASWGGGEVGACITLLS